MHEYTEHEAQNESFTAMVCEQAALFGATPGPDEFDNRPVWDESRGHRRRHQGLRYPGRSSARRHATRGRAGEPPVGLRQHPGRADTEARPRRRQAHPRHPGTAARAGRLGDQVPRTRTRDRPGQQPHGAPRRLRAAQGRRRRGLPRRDRRGMAAEARIARLADRQADLRRHRGARFQSARKRTARTRPTSRREPSSPSRVERRRTDAGKIIAHLDKVKAKYADVVLVHGGGPGAEKIAAGWAERNGVHQIVCKPDWDAHGRAAPFRRNDELLQPAAQGRGRVPGLGHHGQPRRQGENPRHSRPESRRLMRALHGSRRSNSTAARPVASPDCFLASFRSVAAAAPARYSRRQIPPDSHSPRSLRLPPFGVSFSTPHAAGCGLQAVRAPGMQSLAQTPPEDANFLLERVYSLGNHLYDIEISCIIRLQLLWGHTPRFSGEPPVSA